MREITEYLGRPVKDRVTGLKGIVTSVTYDLYGCVQCIVNPGIDKDNKQGEVAWFDVSRLEITDPEPVMELPAFARPVQKGTPNLSPSTDKGPAEKPRAR